MSLANLVKLSLDVAEAPKTNFVGRPTRYPSVAQMHAQMAYSAALARNQDTLMQVAVGASYLVDAVKRNDTITATQAVDYLEYLLSKVKD